MARFLRENPGSDKENAEFAKGRKPYTIASGGKYHRQEPGGLAQYAKGDTILLSEAEAKGASLAGRITPAGAAFAEAPASQFDPDAGRATTPVDSRPAPTPQGAQPLVKPPAEGGVNVSADPGELNVTDATAEIDKMGDADAVDAFRAAEAANKNRRGVLDAADRRLTELKGEGG